MPTTPPLLDLTSVRRDRRSIRFQLSTLLLLSTLNGIAFAAAAVFLLRTMLSGELALLADQTRPEWLDQAVSWFPWALGYVLTVSLATVVSAFRIKQILTNPLDRLRVAAGAVSAGTLETEIPALDGATEIEELSRSVEAMRERLVTSINTLDSRNDELASILDSLHDGVMVLDALGVLTGCSPRTYEILAGRVGEGQPPRQGLPVTTVFPALSGAPLKDQLGKDFELDFPLVDGARRYVSVRLVPIRGQREGGALAVVRDITRFHELEQLKRDFLSVVTHELKTPLTSIEGYTRLLLMGKGGPLTEKQETFARTIIDQTMNLKTMIQNLLDSTRLEGAQLPIQPVVLDASDALQTAADSFRGSAQTRHVTLRVERDGLRDGCILADPFRLQQVLGNLLNNALKFTPEGGEIALLGGREGRQVWLAVADTGRGIPAEALPRLFNKFYQVTQGDTRVAGGAGLGLFICKQLVEAQGGRIEASSTAGEGSRFTLWFPLVQPETVSGDHSARKERRNEAESQDR